MYFELSSSRTPRKEKKSKSSKALGPDPVYCNALDAVVLQNTQSHAALCRNTVGLGSGYTWHEMCMMGGVLPLVSKLTCCFCL